MADYKIIKNEDQVNYMPRANREKTPDSPTTIWDAELTCKQSNDSIGCWPNLQPCLFNVREDPCEMNNLAYYMPQLVETFMFKLNAYNESVKYRGGRKRRSVEETILYKRTVDKLNQSKLKRKRDDS